MNTTVIPEQKMDNDYHINIRVLIPITFLGRFKTPQVSFHTSELTEENFWSYSTK